MKQILFLLCLFTSLFSDAITKHEADSLINLLKKANDTQQVNIYNKLAWKYSKTDLNFTDSFARLAIQKGTAKHFSEGIGKGYINLALVKRNAGEYEQALEYCRWALVHYVKAKHFSGYASAYNTIASIHYMKGEHSKSLYYYFKSLEISEHIHDPSSIARTLNNIGVLYLEQRIYDKALLYYNKAYNILSKLKDENGMADCLNNIGNIYHLKGDVEQAVRNYEKAITFNRHVGDKKDISSLLNNIGLLYYEKNDYKQALNHYHQSLVIDQELGDINAMVVIYNNIASCYIKLEMFHAALKYANESLKLSLRDNMKTHIMNAYHLLYKIETERQSFKEALRYHELYKAYSDSIYSKESQAQLLALEEKYIKEKLAKEEILASQKREVTNIILQEKEKHVSEYIFIVGIVLVTFVLLIYVVFFLIRKPSSET